MLYVAVMLPMEDFAVTDAIVKVKVNVYLYSASS